MNETFQFRSGCIALRRQHGEKHHPLDFLMVVYGQTFHHPKLDGSTSGAPAEHMFHWCTMPSCCHKHTVKCFATACLLAMPAGRLEPSHWCWHMEGCQLEQVHPAQGWGKDGGRQGGIELVGQGVTDEAGDEWLRPGKEVGLVVPAHATAHI